MIYCSECGYQLVFVAWGDRKTGNGDLMGCERCKAVFFCVGGGETVNPHGKAWQKHLINLDRLRQSLEEKRSFQKPG